MLFCLLMVFVGVIRRSPRVAINHSQKRRVIEKVEVKVSTLDKTPSSVCASQSQTHPSLISTIIRLIELFKNCILLICFQDMVAQQRICGCMTCLKCNLKFLFNLLIKCLKNKKPNYFILHINLSSIATMHIFSILLEWKWNVLFVLFFLYTCLPFFLKSEISPV